VGEVLAQEEAAGLHDVAGYLDLASRTERSA
jgi:hypothetical protein